MRISNSVLALAAAAVVAVASSAQASIIHYATLSNGGITVSNITETNGNGSGTFNYGDPGAPSYYGPGSLSSGTINFPITGTLPFSSTSSGVNDSDVLDVKLSFDVSSQSAMPVAAFLSEVGDYFASGTGTGGDDASLLIFSPGGTLLASGTGVYAAPALTTAAIWSNTVGATGAGIAPSFHIVIDNLLHTASIAPTDFASIEKKGVTINLGTGTGGGPGTPEPASLGLLALGGMALVARRRRNA